MISDAVKLSTVERLIATRRPFARALRERFERDARGLRAVIWSTIVVYNLLLATDVFSSRTYGRSQRRFTRRS
jgi:hypothetical protein